MKRFFEMLQPHLARPIFYSVTLKLALGVCAALVWARYIGAENTIQDNHLQRGFFFLTVYFILWAWLQYLVFDGMRPLGDLFRYRDADAPRPNMPFRLKDLLNTDVEAFEGLDPEEKTVCRLCANVIVAAIFLAVYLFLI